MRVIWHDPDGFPGLAVKAVSEQEEPLGTAAARVLGTTASIPAATVSGPPDVVEALVNLLADRLRRECGVRELRASAPTDTLYSFYRDRLGMAPWCEIVSYRRPAGAGRPEPRSPALVRPFRPHDAAALAAITAEAESLVRVTEQFPSRFMVAELPCGLAGYALSYRDGAECQFKALEVHSEYRRLHIGWDLTRDAVGWFDELGLPSNLRTQVANWAARRLYERFGYAPVGQTRMVAKAL